MVVKVVRWTTMERQTERFPLVMSGAEGIADLSVIDDKVDLAKLREDLRGIADGLGSLFAQPLGLPLKTLEVDLTISAEGSVSFLGTGGKVTGEGSIKLSFEKP
jgi:hypothetical protein